jgi:hypothetical protein
MYIIYINREHKVNFYIPPWTRSPIFLHPARSPRNLCTSEAEERKPALCSSATARCSYLLRSSCARLSPALLFLLRSPAPVRPGSGRRRPAWSPDLAPDSWLLCLPGRAASAPWSRRLCLLLSSRPPRRSARALLLAAVPLPCAAPGRSALTRSVPSSDQELLRRVRYVPSSSLHRRTSSR